MTLPEPPDRTGSEQADDGGDPACWLSRVCDACGGLSDDPQAARCDRCGSELPTH